MQERTCRLKLQFPGTKVNLPAIDQAELVATNLFCVPCEEDNYHQEAIHRILAPFCKATQGVQRDGTRTLCQNAGYADGRCIAIECDYWIGRGRHTRLV